jgi:serine/threonine protein kinase
MGAVYEAIDRRLNITVALKETFSTDRRLRRQFAREAHLLAKLDHPGLPRVTDYFRESNRAFIVMQFIPGPDLAETINRRPGPFARQDVIAWAQQLIEVLVYLHSPERQIVHRDIKPHNLKLTATGRITLLDFGLAKSERTESSVNTRRSVFGFTRRYSPPEQIRDEGTTPQSDIYALGATLYHLFTGAKPVDALSRAASIAVGGADPLIPADEICPQVGSDISAILQRAMALSPEDRFTNGEEFGDALREVDQSSARLSNMIARASLPDSINGVSVSTTIAAGPRRRLVIDTLENNSILKTEDAGWLLPEPSRAPLFAAATLGVLLLFGLGFRSDWPSWLDGEAASDEAKKESVLASSDKTLDQSRDAKPGRKPRTRNTPRPHEKK